MTLYQLLVDKMLDHASNAIRNIFADKYKSSEYFGRSQMCDELIKLLSEETLRTEVLTKEEELTRKTTNTVTVTEKGIAW